LHLFIYRTHICIHVHTYAHVQNGKTSLWIACEIKDEPTAATLMEATKFAGAIDLQVTEKAQYCVV